MEALPSITGMLSSKWWHPQKEALRPPSQEAMQSQAAKAIRVHLKKVAEERAAAAAAKAAEEEELARRRGCLSAQVLSRRRMSVAPSLRPSTAGVPGSTFSSFKGPLDWGEIASRVPAPPPAQEKTAGSNLHQHQGGHRPRSTSRGRSGLAGVRSSSSRPHTAGGAGPGEKGALPDGAPGAASACQRPGTSRVGREGRPGSQRSPRSGRTRVGEVAASQDVSASQKLVIKGWYRTNSGLDYKLLDRGLFTPQRAKPQISQMQLLEQMVPPQVAAAIQSEAQLPLDGNEGLQLGEAESEGVQGAGAGGAEGVGWGSLGGVTATRTGGGGGGGRGHGGSGAKGGGGDGGDGDDGDGSVVVHSDASDVEQPWAEVDMDRLNS